MIDDENLHRTFLHFHFQPELLFEGREEIRKGINRRSIRAITWSPESRVRPFQLEVVAPREPGFVQHRTSQHVRQGVNQKRQGYLLINHLKSSICPSHART